MERLLVKKNRRTAIVFVAYSLAHCPAVIIVGVQWAGRKTLLF